MLKVRFFPALGLILTSSLLYAADPIRIAVDSTGGVPMSFLIGGKNVENVITQVVERQGELAALAGEPFTASVNYLGVPGAVILDVSADGRSATLTIPSANYTQNFTAASSEQLDKDIQNFIKKEGSNQLAEMRRQVNRRSPVGITDGNPNSTTAIFAENFFDVLGLNPGRQFGDESETARKTRLSWVSVGGAFNADKFHGWRVSTRLQVDHRLNRKISLVGFLPVNYVSLEGAAVYGVGAGLGASVAVIGDFEERGVRWTLSPFVGGMFRWSEDLAGGGALVSAGLNTALTIPWGERWETSVIVQISDYRGIPFDVDGYELDKVVDQQVFKVGGQVVYRINQWLMAESYLIGNRFLQEAAVQDWATFGVGLQARLGEGWAVRGAYVLDKGPDYVGNSGRLQLNYAF